MTDNLTIKERFDLYGALWALCSRWHTGQASRGYRILSRLSAADYSPGSGLQQGRFESEEQCAMYRDLLKYRHTL